MAEKKISGQSAADKNIEELDVYAINFAEENTQYKDEEWQYEGRRKHRITPDVLEEEAAFYISRIGGKKVA